MWVIEQKTNKGLLTERKFESREDALSHLGKLSEPLQEYYRVAHRSGDLWTDRILTEGLLKNDLDGILLPRISIDEYVPADPNTDNVVMAFFLKGVPESVIPFKTFIEKCNGVLDVDYGDSDTIPNTSIIYAEMDRDNLDYQHIKDMLIQVCMLTDFEVNDFTMTFPHTETKFPFDINIMRRYFISRDLRKNRLAQKQAEKEALEKIRKQMAQMRKDQEEDEEREDQEQQNESMVNHLVSLI